MEDSPSLSGSLAKPAAVLCHAWAVVSKEVAIPVAGALVLCGRIASKKEKLWSFNQALYCSCEMGSKSRSKHRQIFQLKRTATLVTQQLSSLLVIVFWFWVLYERQKSKLLPWKKIKTRSNEDQAFKSSSPYCFWHLLWKSIQWTSLLKIWNTHLHTQFSGFPLISQQIPAFFHSAPLHTFKSHIWFMSSVPNMHAAKKVKLQWTLMLSHSLGLSIHIGSRMARGCPVNPDKLPLYTSDHHTGSLSYIHEFALENSPLCDLVCKVMVSSK